MSILDLREITDELNGVAQSLLGFDEQRATGERLAFPAGLDVTIAKIAEVLSRFVVAPAPLIVAFHEQAHGAAHARLRVAGIELQRAVEMHEGIVEAAGEHQCGAETGVCQRVVRFKTDGLAKTLLGLVISERLRKRRAQAAVKV